MTRMTTNEDHLRGFGGNWDLGFSHGPLGVMRSLLSELSEMDANKDGVISSREFCRAVAKLDALAITQVRCQANLAYIRQSRPDFGLGFQAKVRTPLFLLRSEADAERPSAVNASCVRWTQTRTGTSPRASFAAPSPNSTASPSHRYSRKALQVVNFVKQSHNCEPYTNMAPEDPRGERVNRQTRRPHHHTGPNVAQIRQSERGTDKTVRMWHIYDSPNSTKIRQLQVRMWHR